MIVVANRGDADFIILEDMWMYCSNVLLFRHPSLLISHVRKTSCSCSGGSSNSKAVTGINMRTDSSLMEELSNHCSQTFLCKRGKTACIKQGPYFLAEGMRLE